jgi:hypothetical protein
VVEIAAAETVGTALGHRATAIGRPAETGNIGAAATRAAKAVVDTIGNIAIPRVGAVIGALRAAATRVAKAGVISIGNIVIPRAVAVIEAAKVAVTGVVKAAAVDLTVSIANTGATSVTTGRRVNSLPARAVPGWK